MNKFLARRLVNILNAGFFLLEAGIRVLPDRRRAGMAAKLRRKLRPVFGVDTPVGRIDFYCPNKLTFSRAESLLEKEPETINWINGFEEGDVLWDIGANVGCYTLYAARKGHRVMAFEPSSPNYYLLNRNIELNGLSDKVDAFCLALADSVQLGRLNLTSLEAGGALNEFGNNIDAVDFVGELRPVVLRQGMIGCSMDAFVEMYEAKWPTHVKIDVDGLEDRVVAGALEVFKSGNVKSVLIELDTEYAEYYDKVVGQIEQCGLTLKVKEHSERYDEGRFKTVFNHIFVRNDG